jgi:hypothetical protein
MEILERFFVEKDLDSISVFSLAKNFVITNLILILVYFIYFNFVDIDNLKKD